MATTATLTAQKMATTTPSLPHNQGQTPLTSSTRLSALNMVGDLLRKVGVRVIQYSLMLYYMITLRHWNLDLIHVVLVYQRIQADHI